MDSGVLVPNLFGLKGSEDLGGGTRAVFQLEGQFEVGTGALDGDLFGRQAWVGSTMRAGGTLTLGTSTNSCSCRCRCGGSGRNCRMCR
ncbi:porin [Burkholderia gladioli]|uniref:porin n=1 Tax=Burkholderia gladioli TaxID=28095 RepID=UPI003D1F5212